MLDGQQWDDLGHEGRLDWGVAVGAVGVADRRCNMVALSSRLGVAEAVADNQPPDHSIHQHHLLNHRTLGSRSIVWNSNINIVIKFHRDDYE